MGFAQVNFRIPQELKDKLEQAAKDSGRSITAELVTRLERSFDESTNVIGIFNQDELKELAIEIAKLLSDNRELSQEFIQIINSPNKKPTS
ncbi:Arc family DNA-binding protein [Moraxella osloensis]|nr:Arc family DNA-binding protein [Moraxella osloensis]